MLGDVFNILLKISGDPTDAESALAEVAAELKAFAGLEANARVGVDGAEAARAKLEELQAKIDALHGKDVKVDVDTSKVSVRLKNLRTALNEALGEGDTRRLSGIVREVENLGRDVEAAVGPVAVRITDRIAGAFASLPSKIGSFLTALPGKAFGAISDALGGLLGKIPLVGGAFEGLAGAGAIAIPVMLALGVVIAGLVGSFAAAVAGAGALAVGLAGALAPVAGIALAVFVRLTAIVKDYKQAEQQATQAAQQHADAVRAQEQAQQNLAAAYANLRQQTEAATRAQQDNRQAVIEDALAVRQAQESVDQAHLNVRKAEQALRDFRAQVGGSGSTFADLFRKATDVNFDLRPGVLDRLVKSAAPKATPDQSLQLEQLILDIRNAKLQEQQATNGLHDSNVKLSRDRQTEASFLKQGLGAYPAYAQAVRQVASAQNALATATERANTAQGAAAKKLGQLTPLEQALGKTLTGIGTALGKVFNPIIDTALSGIVAGLRALTGLLANSAVRKGLTDIGTSLGQTFKSVGEQLAGNGMARALGTFAEAGAKLIPALAQVFLGLFRILRDIGVAALPDLLGGISHLGAELNKFDEHARKTGGFDRAVKSVIASFKDWLGLAKALGGFLIAFFGGTKSVGDSLVVTLTHLLQKWTDFLDTGKGQASIRNFFTTLINDLNTMVKLLTRIANVLAPIIDTTFGNPPGPQALKGIGAVAGADSHPAPFVEKLAKKVLDVIGIGGDSKPKEKPPVQGPGRPILIQPGGGRGDDAFFNRLGAVIARSAGGGLRQHAFAGTASAVADHRRRPVEIHNHITAPAGKAPDAETVGAQLTRVMRRRNSGL